MIVGKLIETLQKYDRNLDVLCYTEDENIMTEGHIFRILDIINVSETEAEKRRGDDEIPTLKLGSSEYSENHILIDISGVF